MTILIDWKKYHTIKESISISETKINERSEKLFKQAKINRIQKEKENINIEKLFIKWNLNFNKLNQYV